MNDQLQAVTAAYAYQQLWQQMMPDLATPPHHQFVMWASLYPERLVCRGITRTAVKVRSAAARMASMSLTDASRYAASVMRNECLGRHHVSAKPYS